MRVEGRHWAEVVRRLGKSRTEHMIKNRFNSLLNVARKEFGRELDQGEAEILDKLIDYLKEQQQIGQKPKT